jgi:hypothetical protein
VAVRPVAIANSEKNELVILSVAGTAAAWDLLFRKIGKHRPRKRRAAVNRAGKAEAIFD